MDFKSNLNYSKFFDRLKYFIAYPKCSQFLVLLPIGL